MWWWTMSKSKNGLGAIWPEIYFHAEWSCTQVMHAPAILEAEVLVLEEPCVVLINVMFLEKGQNSVFVCRC
jgi:hypothetical protein